MLRTYGEVRIARDLEIHKVKTGKGETRVANIVGVYTEEIVTAESRRKVSHFLDFEVWDEAVDYVEKHLKKGDTLIILDSTPRENRWKNSEDKPMSRIITRIKKFRILSNSEKESEIVA